MQDKKIPDIRFKGFEDEWIVSKLGNISCKVTEKNHSSKVNVVFTNSAELGIIDQKEYFDRNVTNSANLHGYYIVQTNDFVYNPRISTTAPVGPINRNKLDYIGVMSPLYFVFRITDVNTSFPFIEYFFKSTGWHDFMYLNGNSGARSDRFSINDSKFLELPIRSPATKAEQEKIGKLFLMIDKLIRSLEKKLEKLRNIKQALLNQMFINVNSGGAKRSDDKV